MNEHLEKFNESIMFDRGVERFDRRLQKAEEKKLPTSIDMALKREVFEPSLVALELAANTIPKYRTEEQWQKDVKEIGVANCVSTAYDVLLHKDPKEPLVFIKAANIIGKYALSLKLDINSIVEKDDMNRVLTLGTQIVFAICSIPKSLFKVTEPEQQGIHMTERTVEFTEYALERREDIYEYQRFSSPMFSPMVVTPRSILEGSYYDERLASRVSLSTAKNKFQIAKIRESAVLGAKWLKAVDAIQSVGLKVNTDMIPIIQQAYTMNHLTVDAETGAKTRPFSKLPPSRFPADLKRSEVNGFKSLQGTFLGEFNEARDYAKEEVIYLPAFVDFRGRVYAVPKLNHQSVDWMKSLWLFSEGKPIDTPEAAKWLKIHLANCGDFGKISKAPFDDRVKWVDDNHDRIMSYAEDPFADMEWMTEASEPFCFTAACMEYRKWMTQGSSYICHLPVAVDG